MNVDKDSYTYEYDYENRITKIKRAGPTTVAEFVYVGDARSNLTYPFMVSFGCI